MTHPYFWPYVTRGAEREVHGVASRLAARGHRVRLVTTQPSGVVRRAGVDGIDVRYVRAPAPRSLTRRGVRRESLFAVPAAVAAAAMRVDAAVSYYYSDCAAVTAVRPRRPCILKLTGAVPRAVVSGDRAERYLLRIALERASEVWVNSRYVVDVMADWGREMHVVPAGVDVATFRPCAARSSRPLVVCAAAPDDPRKRLVDLIQAWPHVLSEVPDAQLLLVQSHDDRVREQLLDQLPAGARESVRFDGPLATDALATVYSSAWVTVAPAVHEALGLATLESLACGTPVVGADSGATNELLSDAAVGTLYPPLDPVSCAAAIVGQLAAESGNTRDDCRAVALPYSWPLIVDEVERRLKAVTAS